MPATPLARPDLDDYIAAEIFDNTTEFITGDRMQRVLLYMAASFPNLLTDGDDTGAAPIPDADSAELFRQLALKANRTELTQGLAGKEPAFKPFTTQELDQDKGAFAGLALRPLLKLLINALPLSADAPYQLTAEAVFAVVQGESGIDITLSDNKQKAVWSSNLQIPANPQRPLAPSDVRVNDTANTLDALLTPGYTTASQYGTIGVPGFPDGTPLSAAGGYVENGRLYATGITGEHAVGTVGVYVLGSGARPDGFPATNDRAFTGPTPIGGTITPGTTVGEPGIIVFTTTSY